MRENITLRFQFYYNTFLFFPPVPQKCQSEMYRYNTNSNAKLGICALPTCESMLHVKAEKKTKYQFLNFDTANIQRIRTMRRRRTFYIVFVLFCEFYITRINEFDILKFLSTANIPPGSSKLMNECAKYERQPFLGTISFGDVRLHVCQMINILFLARLQKNKPVHIAKYVGLGLR